MFVKKTQSEIQALTPDEATKYFEAKEAKDALETKNAIELAVKDAVSVVKTGLETANDVKMKAIEDANKLTIDGLTKSNTDLEQVVVKQGKKIKEMKETPNVLGNGIEVAKNLKDQLSAISKAHETDGENKNKIVIKVADYADNAIAVNTHNSIVGAIGAIGNYFAQLIPGFAKKPVPISNILDDVDVMPLSSDRLVSISQTETVNIAITPETTVKPVSNVVWTSIDAPAEAVATIFKTTTKMRRFFAVFVNAFMETLKMYFAKKIPQLVIAQIRLYATPFTAVPAQQTLTAPNNWDALIAMIASQIKLGYNPTNARLSVFAWEAMTTQKATDGHYMLQNNGSINLLDQVIKFGDVSVKIQPDVEFGDDEVLVGDLSVVKVGLDSNLDYTEFYDGGDGVRNLLSHRLEKFVAVIIPVATRTGLTLDTFTNVKAAITKP